MLTCLGALLGLGLGVSAGSGPGTVTPSTLVELGLSPVLPAALAWIGVTLLWRRKRSQNMWDWQSF